MFEQRQNLELFYLNDTVEEQNRILRQINDFIIVLSKALCEYISTQVNSFNRSYFLKLYLVSHRTTD
jgi:hypothetical protein